MLKCSVTVAKVEKSFKVNGLTQYCQLYRIQWSYQTTQGCRNKTSNEMSKGVFFNWLWIQFISAIMYYFLFQKLQNLSEDIGVCCFNFNHCFNLSLPSPTNFTKSAVLNWWSILLRPHNAELSPDLSHCSHDNDACVQRTKCLYICILRNSVRFLYWYTFLTLVTVVVSYCSKRRT